MSSQIRRVKSLSSAEQQSLFGWSSDPFGVAHLGLEWRPKEVHLLLELDGQTVSHVGVLRHEVLDCAPPTGEFSPRIEGGATGGFGLLYCHLVFLRG
jgi:hypothetical protein